LAAPVSRLAVRRKSIVCPVESKRSIQILVLAPYLYIGLVDPIALVRRLQILSKAFVQFGTIEACTQRQMQLASRRRARRRGDTGDTSARTK
jgi:hypothetical protein